MTEITVSQEYFESLVEGAIKYNKQIQSQITEIAKLKAQSSTKEDAMEAIK